MQRSELKGYRPGSARTTTHAGWPKGWLDAVLPRRRGGGALGGVPAPPENEAESGRNVFVAAGEGLRSRLAEPYHDPALADAALRCLDGELTPATVAAMLSVDLNGSDVWACLADHLLAVHGPVFAARTVAELAAIDSRLRRLIRFSGWHVLDRCAHWASIARLLRIRLAAVPDAEYDRVVAALAPYRTGVFAQRVVTSYLVPDQASWVAADCADAAALGALPDALLLFGAAATAEQFGQVGAVDGAEAGPETLSGLATLLDVLGTGAVPVLERWADVRHTRETLEPVWAALAALRSDAALDALVRRGSSRYATAFVRRVMSDEPERAMGALVRAGSDQLLREHVVTNPGLGERVAAGLPDAAAARLRAATATVDTADGPAVDTVPVDDLPPLLHRPPWTVKRRAKPLVVAGLVAPAERAVAWAPGEREAAAAHVSGSAAPNVSEAALESLLAGRLSRNTAELLYSTWPEDILRPVLGRLWNYPREFEFETNAPQWILAVRFGADAVPPLLTTARRHPRHNVEPLLPFADTEVAVQMADWYTRLASVRSTAVAWFTRHPAVAARALVPPALGPAGPERRRAEKVLRLLVAEGFEADVRAAATGYGPAAASGIGAFLATDPLDLLPTRIPTLPAWLDPRLLRPLRLPDGRTLPPVAVGHVCTVLALSTIGEPYAGIDVVRDLCDPLSLEAFVWAMVDRWADAGYPAKERWIYTALGLVGGDDTVERLAPLLARWPSQGAQARAVLGLDILGAIGTDRALMHLDRFARTAKTPTLRDAAAAKIEAIAQARELTQEQLADRLVPDFDLDPDGRMTLDYGPRRFVVGFDEQLRPYVADEAGKPLKSLPKPGARDHPDHAPAAHERFAALKRTVRTVAAEQIARFERAMVWQRRFSAAELATLFVAHPLLQHLARRLVWVTDDGASFRVAEDRTYATVDDDPFELPDDARVGVAHPVHLGRAVSAWAETFADYEILQPFPQLGREVYDSTDPLDRFIGRTTTSGRALSLRSRGWTLDSYEGHSFRLALPGEVDVSVWFDPGVEFIAGFDPARVQTVRHIGAHDGPRETDFGRLDPVIRSEVLRDLAHVLG